MSKAHPQSSPDQIEVIAPMGGYAVLAEADDANYLVTRNVCDCTGLALMALDGTACALAHVFSNRDFMRFGEERLETHAKLLWQEFEAAINKKVGASAIFNAVAFGAHASPYSFEHTKTHGTGHACAAAVSSCISRNFIQSALNTGRVLIQQDRPFIQRPLNFLVDLREQTMELGYEAQPSSKFEARRRFIWGEMFSPRLGLHQE